MTSHTLELDIQHIGGLGDGFGVHEGLGVFVPFTCAGERVRVAYDAPLRDGMHASLLDVLTPAADRQPAPCAHYGQCGGCKLQHLAPAPYAAFKLGLLSRMVAQLGADADCLAPLLSFGAGARRRVEWKIAMRKGVIQIGYFGLKSHQLIDIQHCVVADARIVALLPALRDVLPRIKKPSQLSHLHVSLLDGGLDLLLATRQPLTAADRTLLADWAQQHGILRLSESCGNAPPRIITQTAEAVTHFGNVTVALPAGAFLQASKAAQDAISDAICHALNGAKRVVDLFSGCGTYSFAMLPHTPQLAAFEGDADMVMAMQNAMRAHALEEHMSATQRDLFRHPLAREELDAYDAAIINPPRNGALPQVKAIAQSKIKRVAMVSCNPATFERDARILLASGFRLRQVIPIDQFYWSAHLELFAHFER